MNLASEDPPAAAKLSAAKAAAAETSGEEEQPPLKKEQVEAFDAVIKVLDKRKEQNESDRRYITERLAVAIGDDASYLEPSNYDKKRSQRFVRVPNHVQVFTAKVMEKFDLEKSYDSRLLLDCIQSAYRHRLGLDDRVKVVAKYNGSLTVQVQVILAASTSKKQQQTAQPASLFLLVELAEDSRVGATEAIDSAINGMSQDEKNKAFESFSTEDTRGVCKRSIFTQTFTS